MSTLLMFKRNERGAIIHRIFARKEDIPSGWHDAPDKVPEADGSENKIRAAARHALDHDGDGRPGGSPKPEDTGDLAALRVQYRAKFNKQPFHGWSEDQLRQKIAEAA